MNRRATSLNCRGEDQTRVLILGASIAGPSLAYWLRIYGFNVVVVEKSGFIRDGGYPIDLRGSAVDVVKKMGLLPMLRKQHVQSDRVSFVDETGTPVVTIAPEAITGSVENRDLEVPRGELAQMLYALTNGLVEYRFNESIKSLKENRDGVEVLFSSGRSELFDLVIGADGIRSKVRELVFGDEPEFYRPLGFYVAGFKVPNELRLSRQAIIYNTPGRMAALYAVRENPEDLHAFLTFSHPYKLGAEIRDVEFQRSFIAHSFAGAKWILPKLVQAMRQAEDLYFDGVEQICMTGWSKGRVALVGDAAYAPSFLTGQGSSLALVGAYVLASELASSTSFEAGFTAYEQKMRPYVLANQATVEIGKVGIVPTTHEQLEQRNAEMQRQVREGAEDYSRAEHTAIDLDVYEEIALPSK